MDDWEQAILALKTPCHINLAFAADQHVLVMGKLELALYRMNKFKCNTSNVLFKFSLLGHPLSFHSMFGVMWNWRFLWFIYLWRNISGYLMIYPRKLVSFFCCCGEHCIGLFQWMTSGRIRRTMELLYRWKLTTFKTKAVQFYDWLNCKLSFIFVVAQQ